MECYKCNGSGIMYIFSGVKECCVCNGKGQITEEELKERINNI